MFACRVAREDNQALYPIGCSPEIAMLTTLSSRSSRAPGRTIKRRSEQGSGAQKAWNYCGLEAAPAQKKAADKPHSSMSAGRHGITTIGERFERISEGPMEARLLLVQIGGRRDPRW
jgi:hypothetical protein